jgi:xylulokinase
VRWVAPRTSIGVHFWQQEQNMTARYILAHDLGTTGNKATLFDAEGALVGSAFAAYATHYPQPNWAEQEPEAWWRAVSLSSQQLLHDTGVPARDIAAIGFSGQMMGCVPVDAQGRALRSCIIWADQRAQAQAARMAERCGEAAIYRRNGHRASPAYTAPKILWLRDEQPEIFAAAHCFLQPKDYLIHRLTGAFVTDYSDASGTLLFDLVERRWIDEFLGKLDLDPAVLPALHPSTAVVGAVTAAAAAATGLAAGTPVVVGGGDGSCAGIGAGVIEPGDAYLNIGSSAWISIASSTPVLDPLERTVTFHHVHPERYCPMGTMQSAGGAREWAWRLLHDGDLDLDAAAASAPPGANGLLFLPHLMGERSPYWNPLARGAYVGLAIPHGKAELARAALEGVAFNLRLILDCLVAQSPDIREMRFVGGGSRGALMRQILADVFAMPIHVLALQGDATSWGAAVAAGVGVGLYEWSVAAQRSQVAAVVEPERGNAAVYAELLGLFKESYAALDPVFARLAQMQTGRGTGDA